jgi:hypothetical protein
MGSKSTLEWLIGKLVDWLNGGIVDWRFKLGSLISRAHRAERMAQREKRKG